MADTLDHLTADLVGASRRLAEGSSSADDRWLGSYALMVLAGPTHVVTRRDEALRAAGEMIGAGLKPADRVRLLATEVGRYASGAWARVDRFRATPPSTYAGTARAHLFEAFRFGGGEVPMSQKHLRRILLSH